MTVRITVRAHPNAPRSEVIGLSDGVWHIRVSAPPVEGKANARLVEFLSDTLGVLRSAITVSSGRSGRTKLIAISGLTQDQITQRLSGSA